jgi:hypothetical protein
MDIGTILALVIIIGLVPVIWIASKVKQAGDDFKTYQTMNHIHRGNNEH